MLIFKVVAGLGLGLLLLDVLLYASQYSKLSKSLKRFFVYLLSLFLSDLVSKYLWIQDENNLAILHLFNYVEWMLLMSFFLCFYKKGERKLIWVLFGVSGIMLLLGSVFLYSLNEYNVVGFFSLKLFIIVMSVREIYWYQFGNESHYYFINIGLLLTSVVSSAIFTFGNVLSTFSKETTTSLYVFNGLVFCISLLLIMYELHKIKRWEKNQ